jgi:hypothetical protein
LNAGGGVARSMGSEYSWARFDLRLIPAFKCHHVSAGGYQMRLINLAASADTPGEASGA